MTDYEQEIEIRLQQFQFLTGKGNVKDCNRVLYEILRLMLGRMAASSATEDSEPLPLYNPEPDEALQSTVGGDHISITSDALRHPTHIPTETIPPVTAAARPEINAPHGLTKFGNPRRIRKK